MITKSNYATSHSIAPYFVRIVKDTARTNFIIIDDIEYDGSLGAMLEEIDGGVIWLQIDTDSKVTQLSSAPNGASEFSPSHSELAQLRICIKNSEVFVIHYTSEDKDDTTDRDEVTGYQFGAPSDLVFVKVDHAADKLTIHQ